MSEPNAGQFVTIASFATEREANLARLKLEQAGIPAAVTEESAAGAAYFLSKTGGKAKLQVPARQVDRALKVLARPRGGTLTRPEECPACGSFKVERRSPLPGLLVVLSLGLLTLIFKPTYRCRDCGHQWHAWKRY